MIACRSTCARHVEEALEFERDALTRRGYAPPSPGLAQVERQAITATLCDWLLSEAQRSPFRVVAVEQTESLVIGGLRLSLRIDRIDEAADGKLLVLDYKSGVAGSRRRWEGPRPAAPQLPLYAIALDPQPQAVAFAVLAPGVQRFAGLGASATLLPGIDEVKADGDTAEANAWGSQLDAWRSTLDALADEFARGEASVSPARGAKTCQYCELASVCRIPRTVGAEVDVDESWTLAATDGSEPA